MESYLESQLMPTCLVTLWPWGGSARGGAGYLPACQPRAAPGMELKPGAGPAFAFANETDSAGPGHASLSWPGSQDVTAEVPGHSPVPRTQAASLLPSLFPDPQSRLPKECEL